jgi:hypothetical protein
MNKDFMSPPRKFSTQASVVFHKLVFQHTATLSFLDFINMVTIGAVSPTIQIQQKTAPLLSKFDLGASCFNIVF